MKNVKLLSEVSIASLLTIGGIAAVNNVNSPVNPVASQTVQAATTEQTTIKLPAGYTRQRILAVNNNRISARDKQALVQASMNGMKQNTFYDNKASDKQEMVNTTNLTWAQKLEINRYALSLINSARAQMGKQPWVLNKSAMAFADRVATEYHNNNKSVWDPNHYVAGITRAAVASGLKNAGQVYEDEAGLPITSQFRGTYRTMYALKEQVYFNVKQMLFGGFYGTSAQYGLAGRYTEWEHAGDLLGLRSLKGYNAPTKMFGLSFSDMKNNHQRVSVHFMGVASRYVANRRVFNVNANIR